MIGTQGAQEEKPMIKIIPYHLQKEFLDQTMKKKWRFVQLLFLSATIIAPNFCYDFPGSLEP